MCDWWDEIVSLVFDAYHQIDTILGSYESHYEYSCSVPVEPDPMRVVEIPPYLDNTCVYNFVQTIVDPYNVLHRMIHHVSRQSVN